MSLAPLSSVAFHMLKDASFQSGSCSSLALALFQNRSIATIVDKIKKCCSLDSSCSPCPQLNQKMTEYQIAPIHLAAMSQNLGAISELASFGADLEAKDVHGFTPYLHMALQGNKAGLDLLESLGANTNTRTRDRGTAADFLKYTAPFRDAAEWELREKAIKAHHDIDPVCLEPGVKVVDSIVAKPQVVTDFAWNFRNLLQTTELSSPLFRYVMGNQNEFSKNPPRLAVRPGLLEDLSGSSSKSCGLFAIDPIQKGDIIGYYGGEIHMMINGEDFYEDRDVDPEYLFSGTMPIDAKNFRSPAAMANDGFPNACVLQLSSENRGVGGLPYQVALIACEPIQSGEEILINYGADHDIKSGNRIELRKDAMIRYFAKPSLDSVLNKIRSSLPIDNREKVFTVLDFIEKAGYLSTTPGASEILTNEAGLSSHDLSLIDKYFRLSIQGLSKIQAPGRAGMQP